MGLPHVEIALADRIPTWKTTCGTTSRAGSQPGLAHKRTLAHKVGNDLGPSSRRRPSFFRECWGRGRVWESNWRGQATRLRAAGMDLRDIATLMGGIDKQARSSR